MWALVSRRKLVAGRKCIRPSITTPGNKIYKYINLVCHPEVFAHFATTFFNLYILKVAIAMDG
jgi:hypothetical protein